MTRKLRLLGATLMGFGSFSFAACDSGPTPVPVSGIVLIDGKPLTNGVVQVVPDHFRPAVGKVGPDGRFTLTTHKDDDGCVPGKHPIAVIANESIDPGSQKWHAPKKYASHTSSNLSVTIDGPTKDLKIQLNWEDGGKPFVERYDKE